MSRTGRYIGGHTVLNSGGFTARRPSAKVTGGSELPRVPNWRIDVPNWRIDEVTWIRLQQARASASGYGSTRELKRIDAQIAALIQAAEEEARREDEAIAKINRESGALFDDTPPNKRSTSAGVPAKSRSRRSGA